MYVVATTTPPWSQPPCRYMSSQTTVQAVDHWTLLTFWTHTVHVSACAFTLYVHNLKKKLTFALLNSLLYSLSPDRYDP